MPKSYESAPHSRAAHSSEVICRKLTSLQKVDHIIVRPRLATSDLHSKRWGVVSTSQLHRQHISSSSFVMFCFCVLIMCQSLENYDELMYYIRLVGDSLSKFRPGNSGSNHWALFISLSYLFQDRFPTHNESHIRRYAGGNYCPIHDEVDSSCREAKGTHF